MEKLRTNFDFGEPINPYEWNKTNDAINKLIDGSIVPGSEISTDHVLSASETDTQGKPKTLEAIIQELRQASGRITVDSALSLTSVNPLQNKVVSEHLIFT